MRAIGKWMSGRGVRRALYVLSALMLLVFLCVAGRWGVKLRHWTWDSTEPVRYRADMENAWMWGSRGAKEGYVGLYDKVVAEHKDGNYGLDYVPLRLAVMTLWVKHEQGLGVKKWANTWEVNAPLMRVNMASDAVAGIALMGTVVLVLRRAGKSWLKALWWAAGSGAIFWCNPAVAVSGFGRPTWDVWVLPFFLLSCWSAVGRQWILSGVMLGIGVMFKGQQMAVVGFFLLWMLVAGGPRAVLSWAGGFALAVGAIVSPWLFTHLDPAGVRVVDRLGIALVLGAMVVPAALQAEIWGLKKMSGWKWVPMIPWRWVGTLTVVLGAVALWSRVKFGQGSMNWYEVAFVYGGTKKFPNLEVGETSSLAGILSNRYRWKSEDIVFGTTTLKTLLTWLYAACMVLLGIGAGWQQRIRSTRILAAIPAVWICFFAFMPLMHERYLLWGAACAAMTLPFSPGLAILGLALSAVSWAMTIGVMMNSGDRGKLFDGTGNQWYTAIKGTYPGIGWAVVVGALVFLYAGSVLELGPLVAWVRGKVRRRKASTSEGSSTVVSMPTLAPGEYAGTSR